MQCHAVKLIAEELRKCSNLKQIESYYSLILKTNNSQDCFLTNQYITACSKAHSFNSAVFAFSQLQNPNTYVYNAIIEASVKCSYPLEALRYYIYMLRDVDVFPSSYSYTAVIKSCKALSFLKFGESVHGQVLRNGLGSHVHVQTCFVDFYSSLGKFVESGKVFDEMSERDNVACSTMLTAYARGGDLGSARKLFDEMPEKNLITWNNLISGYVEVGDLESADELFRKMVERDVITWTAMINCYSNCKRYEEALELFYEMKSSGIRPDKFAMSSVISVCAHLGELDQGKEMHLYVMRNGFVIDVYIGSALIDMYAKCGVLERALVVFFKLPDKNLFCWSSIIDGLAIHGYAEEALTMFDKLEKEKIEPNGVIFVSVLSACTHAGLVEEGKRRFNEMVTKYSIVPQIEHYGCMVDLLCRVGLLDEALELIRNMRMQPNAVIWGSLLGGCKIHKNLEIASVAVDRLMVLEPDNSGYYTLLVNMYAEANRWGDVARIRAMMKERGVEKISPGSSWIELEKKMHQFAACDNYHPASEEIYSLLDVLDSELKLYGYVHQFDYVM